MCYLGKAEWHQDRFLSQYFITSVTVFPPAVHSHAKWPQQLMVVLNNAHNKGVRLDTECMYMWQMCCVVTCTRLSSSVEPSFVCLSKSPVNKTPSSFSSGAPPEREMLIFRAFLYISFRVPSKGAESCHRERFSRALHLSLKGSLVNEPPSRFPNGPPMDNVAYFQSLLLHISWIPQ